MTLRGLYGGRLNSTPFAMGPLDDAGSQDVGNGSETLTEQCASVSVAFPLTMMITGMVGNGLAMLLAYRAYQKKENHRKRPFLLGIGSLALTDLTGQLLTSPVVITVYLANRKWWAVDPSQNLCAFFGLAMTVFGLCPLFIASAMAVERTLAIQAPHWYTGHMKTRLTKMVLLCVWLTSFAFALLPMMGIGKYTLQWPGTWCFISMKDHENAPVGNAVFASTFAFLGLFSLAVTLACNMATITALVFRCWSKSSTSRSRKQWGRITMETFIQLLGIMCVLLACWSPLLVAILNVTFNPNPLNQCRASCNQTQSAEQQPECNFSLTHIRLASLNQILDPWVYLLLRKIFVQKCYQVARDISCYPRDKWKGQCIILPNKIRRTTV
ncbi:prostaglandin E2 receptor EP3 subtype [Erythrolamprus reginae]|uniref:prostaglandin E2 receptor EP3 subtype n=1 Tax=Erythrolamprus reginae TaxID=121349 RepID=UPI00396CC684